MIGKPAIRPDLESITRYRWQEGWESMVPDGQPILRLDQNTPPDPPDWYAGAAARLAAVPVQRYPDSRYTALREAIAAYVGFPADQIVATAGADEALVLCALLALSPGDRAYVREPYYAMFGNATRLAGGVLVHEPDGARLHWVCAPHNPTGEAGRPEDTEPRDGLVVIDQAYVEFGGEDLSSLVRERENTVVARTLSKAFAIGGARVGYLIAPPAIAEKLDAIRPPGSISSHSVALAEMALGETDRMRELVAATIAERDRMSALLRDAGMGVPESHTNFLSIDLGEPNDEAVRRLLQQGIVVRTFDEAPNAIRVTVATRPDNDRVLAALGIQPPEPAAHSVADGRVGSVERRTEETHITCRVSIDGSGAARVTTGIGFLDHMLNALAFHSLFDLDLTCTGDLWVDEHHTVEDVALALGQAIDQALGDRAGIARFGDTRAPLDEALCHATVDLGGRGYAMIRLPLRGGRIGGLPSSLISHFFDSLSRTGRMAIHLEGHGGDDHHIVEAAFKALALALRAATARDDRRSGTLPSTQGHAVTTTVTIVDHGAGNLRSLRAAFERTGAQAAVTDQADEVRSARLIVLPGVGAAAPAMRALDSRGLRAALEDALAGGARMLGVCLGMQLLFEASAEGDTPCLGLLPGCVEEIDWARRVPHMGWNDVASGADGPLEERSPRRLLLRPLLRRHRGGARRRRRYHRDRRAPDRVGGLGRASHRRAVPPGEERGGRARNPRGVGARCRCVGGSSPASTSAAAGS